MNVRSENTRLAWVGNQPRLRLIGAALLSSRYGQEEEKKGKDSLRNGIPARRRHRHHHHIVDAADVAGEDGRGSEEVEARKLLFLRRWPKLCRQAATHRKQVERWMRA